MFRLGKYERFYRIAEQQKIPEDTDLDAFAQQIVDEEFDKNDIKCDKGKKIDFTSMKTCFYSVMTRYFAKLLASMYKRTQDEQHGTTDNLYRVLDVFYLFFTLRLTKEGKTHIKQGCVLKNAKLHERFVNEYGGLDASKHICPGNQIAVDDFLSFGLKQLNPSEFFRRYPGLQNSTKARRLDEDRKQQEKSQGICLFKFNSVKSYYAIRAMTTACCKILNDFFEMRSENELATDTEKKEYGIAVLGMFIAEYGCNLSCRMSE